MLDPWTSDTVFIPAFSLTTAPLTDTISVLILETCTQVPFQFFKEGVTMAYAKNFALNGALVLILL